MKKLLIIAIVLSTLVYGVDAHAEVRKKSGHINANCWYAQVQVYRNGSVLTVDLWHLTQRIAWCANDGPHSTWHTVVTKSKRTIDHWENPTWTWNGIDRTEATNHAGRRYRGVWAGFDGLTPVMLVEHNHPWIKMTVYADGHWTYRTGCGC